MSTGPDPSRRCRPAARAGRSPGRRSAAGPASRRGLTITELLLVVAVIGVLIGAGVPRAVLAFENGRVDEASNALLSVWRGQRTYWLEHRTYADDLRDLSDLGLVKADLITGAGDWTYAVDAATDTTFAVSATRQKSTVWTGTLTIDERGALAGSVDNGEGDVVTPPVL